MLKKLHAFHCGSERFPNAIFDPFSSDPAGIREIPYFFYLIEHSQGLVLFDTGANPGLIEDVNAYLGPEAGNWGIDVRQGDDARVLLKSVGLAAEDIDHVVLSHLHYDHAGAMTSFPKAKYWLQSEEWEFAWNPPAHQEAIYIKSEFDVPIERIRLLTGYEDMFGDGTIQLIPTPGHTKGHQSMLVKGASRSYLLAADAAYEPDLADIGRLPAAALTWSPEVMIESRQTLRRVRDENSALVFCTHDTAFRTNVKLAPGAYYD
jgi:N-acyl homoserine lactone hydrolase